MTNQNRCVLENLRLKNYRCFAELDLRFHDRLTVFVALNGGGKTAVLDGATAALRLFVDTMEGRENSKGFDSRDIRRVISPGNKMEPITPVRLEAQGRFLGTPIEWALERRSIEASRTTTVEAQQLKKFASMLSKENQEWLQFNLQQPLFPLISLYGTGRLWDTKKLTVGKQTKETAPNARHRGYTDCLSPSSHFKVFADWFRRFSYEAKMEISDQKKSPHQPQQPLKAVRNAVDTALKPSGWHSLDWDFVEDTIVAQHDTYGRLPVDTLSDGIRTMIGLVADIAHRATRLNPQLGEKAASETPGIVMIDEVDMHLHPEWQQLVLESLQNAFPLIQFIVTTHSPQVISTVPWESIRILKDGFVHSATPGTDGAEAQRILEDVFQVSPRPKTPMSDALIEYLRLVDAHQWESARALELRRKLDEWSQGNEPRLIEADLQIDNMKWEAGQ